jgi:fido (protein-threonine AMPylation protein)
MKREELHPSLQLEFKPGMKAGVEKIDHPRCQDMWFVVPPAPPRTLPDHLPTQAVLEASVILAQQPRLDQSGELDRLVSYLFLRKDAVESSRMEGTVSTLDLVLTPGELFDGWKTKTEGASVRGYAHALESELFRINNDGLGIFTLGLLARLHTGTMELDPKFRGVPGSFREPGKPGATVWIGGGNHRPQDSIFNPPSARHIERCLKDVMAWFADVSFVEQGDAGMGMPLVVRMAVGHAHFEAIHPFSDGNGRVGRMLLSLQMAHHGILPLYLSGYIEANKNEYNRVLREAQKKLDYAPIVAFFSEAIVASHHESMSTRDSIESLPGVWLQRGKFRKDSSAERALGWLLGHPIFTVRQLSEKLDVSHQAAHTAVALLQKKGVIRERTGFERNRVFAAEEVISLLSRRFGSDPQEAMMGAKSGLGL